MRLTGIPDKLYPVVGVWQNNTGSLVETVSLGDAMSNSRSLISRAFALLPEVIGAIIGLALGLTILALALVLIGLFVGGFIFLFGAILVAPARAADAPSGAVAPVIEFSIPSGMPDKMTARYRVAATPDRGDVSDKESCPQETDMIPFEGKMAIPPLRLDASYQEVVAGAPWWVGTYELSGGNSAPGQLVPDSCVRVVLGQQAEPYHPVLLPEDQATLDADRAERMARPQALTVLPPGHGQKDFDPAQVDGLFRLLGFAPSDYRDEPACPRVVKAEIALPTADPVREHLGVVGVVDFDLKAPTRAMLAHRASWLGTYQVAVSDGSMTLVDGSCRDVAGNTDSVQYKAVVLLKKQITVVDNGTDDPPRGNGASTDPAPTPAPKPADVAAGVGGQLFVSWAPAVLGDDSSYKPRFVRFGGGLQFRSGAFRLVLPYLRVGLHGFEEPVPLVDVAGGIGFGLSAPVTSAVKLDAQLAVLAGRGPVRTSCKLDGLGDDGSQIYVCGGASGSESFPAVIQTAFWGLDVFLGASFGRPDGNVRFVLGAQFGFEHHPLKSAAGELILAFADHEETTTSVVFSPLQLVRLQIGPLIRLEF